MAINILAQNLNKNLSTYVKSEPEHTTLTISTIQAIHQALKQTFPTVQFTMVPKIFAGIHSIRVSWENGPTMTEVEAITGKFESRDLDNHHDVPQVNSVLLTRHVTDLTLEKEVINNWDAFLNRPVSLDEYEECED